MSTEGPVLFAGFEMLPKLCWPRGQALFEGVFSLAFTPSMNFQAQQLWDGQLGWTCSFLHVWEGIIHIFP